MRTHPLPSRAALFLGGALSLLTPLTAVADDEKQEVCRQFAKISLQAAAIKKVGGSLQGAGRSVARDYDEDLQDFVDEAIRVGELFERDGGSVSMRAKQYCLNNYADLRS